MTTLRCLRRWRTALALRIAPWLKPSPPFSVTPWQNHTSGNTIGYTLTVTGPQR